MRFFVYQILNTSNGKVYIGQTIDPKRRWHHHKYYNKKTNQHFTYAFKKYGVESFQFYIIQELYSKQEMDDAEIYWIKYYNSKNDNFGYNITEGGSKALGFKHSEETKLKLSLINKGKTASEETRKKLSEAGKGRISSKETREKLSKSNTGKKRSQETCKKLKISNSKRKHKKESKEKISINTKKYFDEHPEIAEATSKRTHDLNIKHWQIKETRDKYIKGFIGKIKNTNKSGKIGVCWAKRNKKMVCKNKLIIWRKNISW